MRIVMLVLCGICIAGIMHKHAKMPVYEKISCLEKYSFVMDEKSYDSKEQFSSNRISSV